MEQPPGQNSCNVRLSELFADGKNTLIIYSFMFGPKMERACPSCTSILDGLDGETPHVTQRVNFAVVAKSPIEQIMNFAESRGWRNLRLLSSANNTYNRDYHGEDADEDQIPALNVFVKRDGAMYISTIPSSYTRRANRVGTRAMSIQFGRSGICSTRLRKVAGRIGIRSWRTGKLVQSGGQR